MTELACFNLQVEISQLQPDQQMGAPMGPRGRWSVTLRSNYLGEVTRTFDSYLGASVWAARELGKIRPHVELAASLAGKPVASQ